MLRIRHPVFIVKGNMFLLQIYRYRENTDTKESRKMGLDISTPNFN